jgi:NodT family efflux transporter outer membrane factor (OMF) lipoprotein
VFKKAFLTILVLVLVAGCSVHKRQPIEPPKPVPESFIEEDSTYAVYPIGKWWEQFNDEKLNALMEEALQNNLDITVAFARLEQLQAVTRATSAAQKPFLDAEGEIKRESSPSFLGDYTGNSYQVSLLAGYEVDLWEKYKSQTKAAALETEASYEDIRALYMSLSAQLVELYYLAVEQRAQLSLTDSTIASFEDALKRVELRYRQGLAPALDVYQAQQNLARARAGRPVFEANLAVTEHALATLLGRYPDRETAGDLGIIPEIPSAFPAGLPSEMLARRPDIEAAILRVKASDERIAAAIADRFPSFNLIGSYGKSSMAFVTGDIVGVFWNAILNVAQPIFDGGRRSAEVDRTRAVFKENLAMYHKAVLTAFQEVEDALTRNRTSEEHIVLLNHQKESSSNALRVSTFRYMEGLSDYLPVLAAQQSHYESESAILSARRQLISDRVQLARALGGEWMDEYIDERFIADNEEDNKQ